MCWFFLGKGPEKVYLLDFRLRKVRKTTKNAETAKNIVQTVFDPSFFHTMLGGALGNRASKQTGKKKCYPRDMAMRKTTSRLREPHTFSRPDFAKVYLIWVFFLNRTLSGPPVSTKSTFSRPSLTTGKGLEKVYLLDFGLRKVRKMTKNAETAKNTIQNVCDPSFFHTLLGGALGSRTLKKD